MLLKTSVLFALLLSLSPLSKAEGHYETFQEICEFTGEIKETVVYIGSTELSVVEPVNLEEN